MAKRFLTPLNLPNLASNPETGTEGDLYFNTVDNVIKIYIDSEWTDLQGGGGSVIGGTNINVDYNEESNTYTVNAGSNLETIESINNKFIHNNHNNIVSSYDEENNEIILSASVSSGAAIANTDLVRPDANSNTGLLYFDPNQFTFNIAYGGVWLQLANASTQVSGGDSSTTNFEGTFDGGDSSSTYESYLVGGNS